MMSDGQKYGSIMLDCRHKNADNVFWKIWEFQQKIGESNKKGEKKINNHTINHIVFFCHCFDQTDNVPNEENGKND